MPGLLTVAVIEVEALEYLQRHQRHQPLPARWNFPDVDPAIIDLDRLDPLRAVVLQVAGAQVTTRGPGVCVQPLCQRTTVETFTTAGRQLAEGASLGRVAEQFTGTGRTTFNQKGLEPAFKHLAAVGSEILQCALPLQRNHRRHGKAIARQTDCRLQQLGKRQSTETFGQLSPGRRATRNGDRRPAMQRHLFMARGFNRLDAQGLWRSAIGVQTVQFVLRPDQRKRVATNTATGGLDNG
ncbi:hypothetical protein D3C85_860380 [compost metagenome]